MNPKLLDTALRIAVTAHAGQVDKSGEAYILHPVNVALIASRYPVFGPDARLVGLLHDVLEDTKVDVQALAQAGIPRNIILAVEHLTKLPGETYKAYLNRIPRNTLALVTKVADIHHNTSPERLRLLDPETQTRLITKYTKALAVLDPLRIHRKAMGLV